MCVKSNHITRHNGTLTKLCKTLQLLNLQRFLFCKKTIMSEDMACLSFPTTIFVESANIFRQGFRYKMN